MVTTRRTTIKIAVLFDGAGLSRLGLEQAGHDCTGFEISPEKHELGKYVGSGNTVLADVRNIDISKFDAVWASPPCQMRSAGRHNDLPSSEFYMDLLDWSLKLPIPILWVENVFSVKRKGDLLPANNGWGKPYNANQFLQTPIQNRRRIIGGRYILPHVFRPYNHYIKGICPTITATEYKARTNNAERDRARASRFYKRKLTIEECAYHQGLTIPKEWYTVPSSYNKGAWTRNIYEAIGNGVPVYMARAFGSVYK